MRGMGLAFEGSEMREIYRSEKIWAVSIEWPLITGGVQVGLYGAGRTEDWSAGNACLFRTEKQCQKWIADTDSGFRESFKPRPCRVVVTVEGER